MARAWIALLSAAASLFAGPARAGHTTVHLPVPPRGDLQLQFIHFRVAGASGAQIRVAPQDLGGQPRSEIAFVRVARLRRGARRGSASYVGAVLLMNSNRGPHGAQAAGGSPALIGLTPSGGTIEELGLSQAYQVNQLGMVPDSMLPDLSLINDHLGPGWASGSEQQYSWNAEGQPPADGVDTGDNMVFESLHGVLDDTQQHRTADADAELLKLAEAINKGYQSLGGVSAVDLRAGAETLYANDISGVSAVIHEEVFTAGKSGCRVYTPFFGRLSPSGILETKVIYLGAPPPSDAVRPISKFLDKLVPGQTYAFTAWLLFCASKKERLEGKRLTFETPPISAATGSATSITENSAILHGAVNTQGADYCKGYFHFRGDPDLVIEFPVSGVDGPQPASTSIDTLEPGRTYAYTVELVCTLTHFKFSTESPPEEFKTPGGTTTVTTGAGDPDPAQFNHATLNGTVSLEPSAANPSAYFQYGRTTAYGETANASLNGCHPGVPCDVHADVTDLAANTVYHFRLAAEPAENAMPVLGSDQTFKTSNAGTFTWHYKVTITVPTKSHTLTGGPDSDPQNHNELQYSGGWSSGFTSTFNVAVYDSPSTSYAVITEDHSGQGNTDPGYTFTGTINMTQVTGSWTSCGACGPSSSRAFTCSQQMFTERDMTEAVNIDGGGFDNGYQFGPGASYTNTGKIVLSLFNGKVQPDPSFGNYVEDCPFSDGKGGATEVLKTVNGAAVFVGAQADSQATGCAPVISGTTTPALSFDPALLGDPEIKFSQDFTEGGCTALAVVNNAFSVDGSQMAGTYDVDMLRQ